MNQQQAIRLLQAGPEMRKAQKKRAITYAATDRRICKELEKQFDKVVQECSQGHEQQLQLI